MKKLNLLLLICAGIFLMIKVSAQEWVVPEDKKDKKSPFIFTSETASKGESVFKQNCVICHGEPSKGTYNKGLVPSPGDPASDKFQKETDGALFYKLTIGRGAMPQFKDVLTEEQRWEVISYFRSFNKGYVQPSAENKAVASSAVRDINLTLSFLAVSGQIKALLTDKTNNPVAGAEIGLFVKRYFGNLKLGESSTTNDQGIAFFDFPKDLPGDKKGNVVIISKVNAGGNETEKKDTMAIGIPTDKPPLTANRAMWNVMAKAPLWLLLSYSFVVIGIWGFLIYIIILLVKLKKVNK